MKTNTAAQPTETTRRYVVQIETYDMGAWREGYKRRVDAVSEADAMALDENDYH